MASNCVYSVDCVEELMKKGIWDNTERMNKWLNDRDNIMFRTSNTIL